MKNKKILIIALFLILFCLLGYSKCFASSIPENMKEFGDDNPYFIVFKDKDDRVYLVSSWGQATVTVDDDAWFDNTVGSVRIYEYIDNKWVLKLDRVELTSYSYFKTGAYCRSLLVSKYGRSIEVVGSNYDIFRSDDKSQIFFPKTPLENGIVAQAVEKVEMSQVQAEILGILPMILVVLVSLVGLRKGLKMLETFLRQS